MRVVLVLGLFICFIFCLCGFATFHLCVHHENPVGCRGFEAVAGKKTLVKLVKDDPRWRFEGWARTCVVFSVVLQHEAANITFHSVREAPFLLSRFFSWLSRVFYLLLPICRITESHPIRLLNSVLFCFFFILIGIDIILANPNSSFSSFSPPTPSHPCRVWWSSCRTFPRCTGATRKWASSWPRPTGWSLPSQTHPTTTRDDEPKCCHAPASSSSSLPRPFPSPSPSNLSLWS